jgi:hypothetical protein
MSPSVARLIAEIAEHTEETEEQVLRTALEERAQRLAFQRARQGGGHNLRRWLRGAVLRAETAPA